MDLLRLENKFGNENNLKDGINLVFVRQKQIALSKEAFL